MKKFEYQTLCDDHRGRYWSLSQMGMQGWELVSVTPTSWEGSTSMYSARSKEYIFKREIREENN